MSRTLGAVHGDIGLPLQGLQVVEIVDPRIRQAGTDAQRLAHTELAEIVTDDLFVTTLGNAQRRVLVAVEQDHREFVAADAEQLLTPPQHRTDAAGDHLEHLVTDAVTVGVVDRLEVVDVEQRETHVDVALAEHAAAGSA